VRQLIVGKQNPASYPGYSHKYAFRGLIPMSVAEPVLGLEKTETRHMYLGPDSHALTFPVAGGKLLNVVAFTTDDNDWPHPDKFTAPASKADAIKAFAGFAPTVRAIINLLPEQLDKWAVFDTYDNPVPFFTKGRICISGDAAHAAAPYHGAGAGFAIEDGVVLAHLLAAVNIKARSEKSSVPELSRAALQAYNATRFERARWLVETSRFVGKMYEWQDEQIGDNHRKCAEQIEWRSRQIWDYDIEKMLSQASINFTTGSSNLPKDEKAM
jgi:salicylate hydroxylase